MVSAFEKYKGIHPGAILQRELKKRKLNKISFAFSIHEDPDIFEAITDNKQPLNSSLAFKAEKALGIKEGTLMELQQYYETKIRLEEKRRNFHPSFSILRKVLFWDTDMNSIDWEKQSRFVVQRVFERGNEEEKAEITRFYGLEKVSAILKHQRLSIGKIHVMGHLKPR